MSMSQEEIEALMNETAAPVVEKAPVVEEVADDTPMSAEDIAALVSESDANISSADDDNINDILAGIDGITDDKPVVEESAVDMDDILAGIDGITDDKPVAEESSSNDADVASIMNEKINSGVYPMPMEKEHQVVNQLNEVAEDSEEKASQIFDVLSFILDENNIIQKNTKTTIDFIGQQIILLEALSKKFPNVAVFSENLAAAQSLNTLALETNSKIDEENNQIFVAMDLMQYHDINRQKIERVMSVIRKLSIYLNGIFEDNSGKAEVQIAKHISGDGSDIVSDDDIDSLIADFSN